MEHESDHVSDVGSSFDFQDFFLKVLSYWKLILLAIVLSLVGGYFYTLRKAPVYRLGTLISIKDDQNPFFTSNTSLTFNWGGTSDKVSTAVTILQSRTHNEEVVESLQFYLSYQKEGKYKQVNAYAATPFQFVADAAALQAMEQIYSIQFKDRNTFNLASSFPGEEIRLFNYATKESKIVQLPEQEFSREYKINELINLPYFKGTFLRTEVEPMPGEVYYLSFLNFDEVVEKYRNLSIGNESSGSSVLLLHLTGDNKAEIVDYLNGSVRLLSENMLRRKNLFATKTISFIDSSLSVKSMELQEVEEDLNAFRNTNAIIDLSVKTDELTDKLSDLDMRKETLNRQLSYYESLHDYLDNRNDYSNVPAPSVAGIQEESIIKGVGRIINLAEERRKYQYSLRGSSPVFADIDRQINAVKATLVENLQVSQRILQRELLDINQNIGAAERSMRQLPKEEQDLLKIQRKYALSEKSYNLFLEKRNEAGLVRAANVSDVMIIDMAKDTGQKPIGPNKQLNYVMATLVGGMLPLSLIFLLVLLNNKVHNAREIAKLSPIPILGTIGRNEGDTNWVVASHPASALAEAFRGLRSSLQFLYTKQELPGAKTILVTSSVSGEGKTFCAINLASVLALSEKKTLLLGADLRKPKIFDEFKANTERGITNYLIGQQALEAVIQATELPFLEVISSGPIPPNPSELLMNERMKVLMETLKESYDYIVLDSPPVGVVADALSLTKYADATLYIIRQDYTKRSMLDQINEKYRNGEVKNISFVLNHFLYQSKYGYGDSNAYSHGYGSEKSAKKGIF